jgi:glycogen debranching enzyme
MKEDSTVANGRTFLVTDENGRLSRPHDGLYHDDTRHFDQFSLSSDYSFETICTTAPRPGERVLQCGSELERGARSLHLTRRQAVTDGFVERLEATNLEDRSIETTIELTVSARFEDLFEVRSHTDTSERTVSIEERDDEVQFVYDPADIDYRRSTSVRVATDAPIRIEYIDETTASLSFDLSIPAGETETATIATGLNCVPDDPAYEYSRAIELLDARHQRWDDTTDRPTRDDPLADRVLAQSETDLLSLTMETEYGPVLTAGTPWFATAFGRDSIIAAYQTLPMTDAPAKATLRYLADLQATEVDEFRAAAPGKILHEIRHGEATVRGDVPHAPYYGTIDATPLYVVLLHETWKRTGDDDLLEDLWPTVEAALDWCAEYGDSDGDGFLEYPTDGHDGLTHRAWKDSGDGIVHPDGTHPTGPLAVAEVQGYYYDALTRAAELSRYRGDDDRASTLEGKAETLADHFDEAYWIPEESFYAVALDGDNEPIESVTTNPGHCLWSGIVPEERAAPMVDRFLSEDLLSGWGIRTLSSEHEAYNPQSYHLGSVWPHDNSLVVLGMVNYGFEDAAAEVTDGLLDAARARGSDRLPELFSGFERAKSSVPIEYGVACEPQAWAAGTPIACVGALDGQYDHTHREEQIQPQSSSR